MKNIEKFINIMQGSGFSDSIDDEDGSLVLKRGFYNDKKIIFKNNYNSFIFTNEDVSISIFNDDGYFEGMVCNGLDDIIFSINDDCKILNTISKKTKVNIKIINMFGNTELNLVQ